MSKNLENYDEIKHYKQNNNFYNLENSMEISDKVINIPSGLDIYRTFLIMIEKIHKLSPSSINTNIVNVEDTLMSCLKSLENSEYKFLVVKEGEIVKGVITDGDIRRYLFSTSNLNTPIKNVINEKFYFVNKETSILKIREIMNKQDVKFFIFR